MRIQQNSRLQWWRCIHLSGHWLWEQTAHLYSWLHRTIATFQFYSMVSILQCICAESSQCSLFSLVSLSLWATVRLKWDRYASDRACIVLVSPPCGKSINATVHESPCEKHAELILFSLFWCACVLLDCAHVGIWCELHIGWEVEAQERFFFQITRRLFCQGVTLNVMNDCSISFKCLGSVRFLNVFQNNFYADLILKKHAYFEDSCAA